MHIDTVATPKLRFRTVRFWIAPDGSRPDTLSRWYRALIGPPLAPENRTRPTWRARRCARVQSQYCHAVTRRRAASRRARKARRITRGRS